jgi:hypothetical protein
MACPQTTFNAIGFVTELFGHSPSVFKKTRGKVTRSPNKPSQEGILWELGLEWELIALISDSRGSSLKRIKEYCNNRPEHQTFYVNKHVRNAV